MILIMALSQQVEDSLRESQECLRNALAFSARNEKPYISKHIADMLMTIDSLIDMQTMVDIIETGTGDS
jgi:hypothetical protein